MSAAAGAASALSALQMDLVDDWEMATEESLIVILQPKSAVEMIVPEIVVAPMAKPAATKPVKRQANPYNKYPYFMAGVQGTLLKQLFPLAKFPEGELKKRVETEPTKTLTDIVMAVRNDYIMPLFQVAKSTRYFNPVTKTRVPAGKKERVDPNLAYVSLDDQLRFYRLFGFQGHLGTKKMDEDAKRDELLELLKQVLYHPPALVYIIQILLGRMSIEVHESDLNQICRQICEDKRKSYGLPAKWHHDSSWKKLHYVYGEGSLANMGGGGDGQFDREMMRQAMAAESFIK